MTSLSFDARRPPPTREGQEPWTEERVKMPEPVDFHAKASEWRKWHKPPPEAGEAAGAAGAGEKKKKKKKKNGG